MASTPEPNYIVTVPGHPDSPFRVFDPTIGCLSAALVRKCVEASDDDPYTMGTEILVARIGADGVPEAPSYCESVSIHDPLAEARHQAMVKECEGIEQERQRIEAARKAEEQQRIADDKQVADTKPGHYYVSAVPDSGECWFAMVGPLATHQQALDLVDDVRRYAREFDPRSPWYRFGTNRVASDAETVPTGKIALSDLDAARLRWNEVAEAKPKAQRKPRK